MGENVLYTKGDKETVLKRIYQIHTITLYCPLEDYGVCVLRNTFLDMLSNYMTNFNKFKNVPTIDILKCFLIAKSILTNYSDTRVLGVMMSAFSAFPKLKCVSFEFVNDQSVWETYNNILSNNKENVVNNIYKVDRLELNLSDMFEQKVIDHFNKVLIHNELVSNDYLKRTFRIDFTYDEYVSFMDMFLGNNGQYLNRLDNNICDYFRMFPEKIEEYKPEITVITNYSDL